MAFPSAGTVQSLYYITHAFIGANTEPTQVAESRRFMQAGLVALIERDIAENKITFNVRENHYTQAYEVAISNYYYPPHYKMECTCNAVELCKHKLASLLYIAERLPDSQVIIPPDLVALYEVNEPVPLKEVIANMPAINLEVLNLQTNRYDISLASSLVNSKKVSIVKAENMEVVADVVSQQTRYHVVVRKTSDTTFHTYCNCNKIAPVICEHRYAVFYQLLVTNGKFYFESFKDQTVLKNELLEQYGYIVDNMPPDTFDFANNPTTGKLEIKVKDLTLQKISKFQQWDQVLKQLKLEEKPVEPSVELLPGLKGSDGVAIGFAFNFNQTQFPFFSITPFTGKLTKDKKQLVTRFEGFLCSDPPRNMSISQNTRQILYLLQEISEGQLLKVAQLLGTSAYMTSRRANFAYIPFNPAQLDLMRAHIHSHLLQIMLLLENEEFTFVQLNPRHLSRTSLARINISSSKPKLALHLETNESTTDLTPIVIKNDDEKVSNFVIHAGMFLLHENTLHLLDNNNAVTLLNFMGPARKIKVNKNDTLGFLRSFVLPLQKHFNVELPEQLIVPGLLSDEVSFKKQVYLRELHDHYLILRPAFRYNDQFVVECNRVTTIMEEFEDKIKVTQRKIEEEAAFKEAICTLHPSFRAQDSEGFFHLTFEEALKEGWFFKFISLMKAEDADIYGLKEMKKFRYNANTPKITFSVGTGIDWFDVKINITFGDQYVKLKDLRKAVLNEQNYVLLDDGSIGMLPEEWSKKYSMLFKMSDAGAESLKVSKFHFSLIDEMYDQIDNDQIRRELDHKKNKLKNFSKIDDLALPEKVNAKLRPYQKAGFNWFHFLDEFGWGGILADDMGLGKTLQALTFFQHLKNKRNVPISEGSEIINSNEPSTHLIVCPNSLMFNWENEIHKFCPDLTYHIQHGGGKKIDVTEFADYDIIITTYGTIRADIETFLTFKFHYIILDESQAIKNPASKSAKAVQLLRSKNRLALSGTPVQNNIFDLYAQMHFLNPGMLGNMEFFKNEFANPIDKSQDELKKDQLRKLIFPFLLRRTKEQVAKELPKKVEIVLYCEMGHEQRRVYYAFKHEYRDRIMKRIAEEGLAKSGIYVLQGLMKLRQVCDSPAILKDDEVYTHESVKLEELTREITENTVEHKVLVFSQFIGMLQLIKTRLDHHHIKYSYLDGQSTDRKESVELFQMDPSYKVFLISLKAGGVGLNLTAADYVYIVDPWWNPAVEQQAIDRTHRIGQTRNIFAYKMICKDTIEEKMLLLQDKKKILAKDIVADDTGFLKNLTKDDIDYLFS